MKILILAAVGLFGMGSVAMAAPLPENTGPVKLTDADMDKVTAGQLIEVSNNDIAVQVPVSANVQACIIVEQCRPTTNQPVNARANF